VTGPERAGDDTNAVLHELLRGLETIRSRLAVVVASETKRTPLEQWHFYFETEDRMRRCLKGLRSRIHDMPMDSSGWAEALEAIRHPRKRADVRSKLGEAHQLCLQLREVLALLNQCENL